MQTDILLALYLSPMILTNVNIFSGKRQKGFFGMMKIFSKQTMIEQMCISVHKTS